MRGTTLKAFRSTAQPSKTHCLTIAFAGSTYSVPHIPCHRESMIQAILSARLSSTTKASMERQDAILERKAIPLARRQHINEDCSSNKFLGSKRARSLLPNQEPAIPSTLLFFGDRGNAPALDDIKISDHPALLASDLQQTPILAKALLQFKRVEITTILYAN
jgi:hypothetical protein